jgi:hypothetical protein
MGIDGIGSKGPPAPPPPTGAPGAARAPERPERGETTRAFEVGKPGATVSAASPQATQATHATALDRLRAGEIDVHGYVDAKVHEATAHLGVLPPARLDEIRAALRDRMTSDPALAELLRTATGHVVPPQGDD